MGATLPPARSLGPDQSRRGKETEAHERKSATAVHLDSDHGNYFNLDSVELVEAAPASRLHKPRENPADGLIVLPV